MRTPLLRRLSAAALFAAALAAAPARADEKGAEATAAAPAEDAGFSTANVQLLQGWNFHDINNNAFDGNNTTVTFNYFTTYRYGDVNMFVDFMRTGSHYTDFTGGDAHVYGEVQPRLFLGKLLGLKGPIGIFQDFGPAFELNQGQNFYAYLAGLGGNFALPQPYVLGLNLYYRYDKFVGDGWQATTFWGVPFNVGPVGFALAGFADFSKAKTAAGSDSIDIISQPQALVDVGALWHQPRRWWIGTEWWLHYNPVHSNQSAQLLLQYTIR